MVPDKRKASGAQVDELIAGANVSGFTIDYLAFMTDRLSAPARRRVIAKFTALHDNLKASNNTHVRRGVAADIGS